MGAATVVPTLSPSLHLHNTQQSIANKGDIWPVVQHNTDRCLRMKASPAVTIAPVSNCEPFRLDPLQVASFVQQTNQERQKQVQRNTHRTNAYNRHGGCSENRERVLKIFGSKVSESLISSDASVQTYVLSDKDVGQPTCECENKLSI